MEETQLDVFVTFKIGELLEDVVETSDVGANMAEGNFAGVTDEGDVALVDEVELRVAMIAGFPPEVANLSPVALETWRVDDLSVVVTEQTCSVADLLWLFIM